MEIAGCHQLKLSYESKCENLHGHNWVVTIHCKAQKLNQDGMVTDFTKVKQQIHGYLDHGLKPVTTFLINLSSGFIILKL